tara:strand:- start:4019 stop:4642 length:624 start_codon:yes stop_codon:yes gene_type:complete
VKKKISRRTNIILIIWCITVCQVAAGKCNKVEFITDSGTFIIEIYPDGAPLTSANFIRLINNFHYDGLIFHRVIPEFVIQTGGYTFDFTPRKSQTLPIPNEGNHKLKNVRGTVAMARTSDPHSARSQFFINITDNPSLDSSATRHGYAVFGKVVDGMATVDAIAAKKTQNNSLFKDVPITPIRILKARELQQRLCNVSVVNETQVSG